MTERTDSKHALVRFETTMNEARLTLIRLREHLLGEQAGMPVSAVANAHRSAALAHIQLAETEMELAQMHEARAIQETGGGW